MFGTYELTSFGDHQSDLMDGTMRLFEASVHRKARRASYMKYVKSPAEEAEWQKKLGATNLLSIPTLSIQSRPFTSQAVNGRRQSVGALQVTVNTTARHPAFPGKVVNPSRVAKETFVKPKLPSRAATRAASRARSSFGLESTVDGIQGFALPTPSFQGNEQMVSCRSSITAFYDAQGTY